MHAACAASVLCAAGCPSRDPGDAPPAPTALGTTGGSTKNLGASPPPTPSDSIAPSDVPTIAPLALGMPLPRDVSLDPLDPSGMEMTWTVTPRDAPTPVLPPEAMARDAWSIVLAEGRAALQLGPHSSLARDGTALRFDHDHAGAIQVLASGAYRIVPPGAARAFLDEGRADVLPLVASSVAALDGGTKLGHATVRARLTTAYGVIDLEQIVVEPRVGTSSPPAVASSKGTAPPFVHADAGATNGDPLDGGGGALCRFLLDLVASDRVLGGEPCASDRVPVHASIAYVGGGGLVVDASALRETTVARDDVAFPPFGAPLSPPIDDHEPRALVSPATLLALRAKGDVVSLEVTNDGDRFRVALLDGLPVLSLPSGASAVLSVRAATYRFEWRTPIGEIVAPAFDVVAPSKITAAQSTSLPGSPSAMASALKAP